MIMSKEFKFDWVVLETCLNWLRDINIYTPLYFG